jgi:indoleacetamide hydrolase
MTDTVIITTPNRTAASAEGELATFGLAGAAEAIRRGDFTSEAYAAALLQRARLQSDLNAFVTIDEASVLAAARDADKTRAAGASSPLLGVPLGIKDSYVTKGIATSLGLKPLASFVPQEHAEAVRAVKEAGALVLGKTRRARKVRLRERRRQQQRAILRRPQLRAGSRLREISIPCGRCPAPRSQARK